MQELFANELAVNLMITGGIIVVAFLIVRVGHRVSRRYFDDPERIYRSTKSTRRLALFLSVVSIVILWSPGFGDLLTLLTVIGAGMAIALREVLLAIGGWARITLLSSFKEGDRIEINGLRGDVIDVRVMRTTVMEIGGWVDADQSTGRIVHFPNSWVFQYALYNYTRSFKFIWNELEMKVTFRSDWRAARDIMMKYAEESAAIVEQQARNEIHLISREFLIHYSILTPFVYVKVVEDGVSLTLRYLCEARKRRGSEHALTVMFLDDFKDHDNIDLAHRVLATLPPGSDQWGASIENLNAGSAPPSAPSAL